MPGGVLLQELLPKGRYACPLLSSHSAFMFFFPLSLSVSHTLRIKIFLSARPFSAVSFSVSHLLLTPLSLSLFYLTFTLTF